MSENHFSGPAARSALPWRVWAIVIVCALLMTTGAIIALVNPAMLAGPDEKIGAAAVGHRHDTHRVDSTPGCRNRLF